MEPGIRRLSQEEIETLGDQASDEVSAVHVHIKDGAPLGEGSKRVNNWAEVGVQRGNLIKLDVELADADHDGKQGVVGKTIFLRTTRPIMPHGYSEDPLAGLTGDYINR